MSNKHMKKVLDILYKYYPASKTTLNNMRGKSDAYKILISCLLSLRARDENTEVVSRELFEVADTPQKMVALKRKRLEKLIFSSGHYRKKAEALQHVSKEILERFNGKVPKTREELLSIKHIGPKTAAIVLAFAYGEVIIPVDTHCHRIPNRLGWIETKTAEKSEVILNKIIPQKYKADFNSVFIQFGRDICQPVSPKCSICPVRKFCPRIGVTRSR